jgi:hypothetical protein
LRFGRAPVEHSLLDGDAGTGATLPRFPPAASGRLYFHTLSFLGDAREGTLSPKYLFLTGLVIGGAFLVAGREYYLLPLDERAFSPLNDEFAPTGLIGQGLGIFGTLMIAFGVISYGARKRIRALARFGKLKDWLHFHIFLCLLGPFLIVLHTTFKFGGLVAIAFWSMVLVVTSGIFGRWVYVWIPKTANGQFLGREEIRQRLRELLRDLGAELGMTTEQLLDLLGRGGKAQRRSAPQEGEVRDRRAVERGGSDRRRRKRARLGIIGAIYEAIRYALGHGGARRRFQRVLSNAGVREPARSRIVRSLEEERRIEQQLRMIEPFQAAFRYWHAFHLPLAVVMALILVVHVGVAIAFGYTWIWAS